MTLPLPFNSGKNRVRMRDVANRCGVSISTVSLVLSGDSRIPEDTTRRVLETVKAMEYRPSVVARSLARRVSRNIGVVLPERAFGIARAFYQQALEGIHAETQPAGYKMHVEVAGKNFLSRRYYLRVLKEQSVDGMVYLAATINDTFLREMEKEPYPFVLVGGSVDGADLPCAKADDVGGAEIAVQHLISLGHKKIAHIAGSSEISNGRDRELGYRNALAKNSLEVDPAFIKTAHFDSEKAELLTKELVDKGVTAFFAGSDTMAYGILKGLEVLGIKVPGEIAVMGMDDLEFSKWTNPSLSTVKYDIRSLAGLAARQVLRFVQNSGPSKIVFEDLPKPELVIRASCGFRK
ncbi:MAG: LacI family DNA-binding transcriptional regulator [Elusimicrobiota bacterium]